MFSIFDNVLALVRQYERGEYSGIEVDFEETGLYYDSTRTPNWWEYYCVPIRLGEKSALQTITLMEDDIQITGSPQLLERQLDRAEAHRLIKKYIHFLPHIQQIAQEFVRKHFKNFYVIGVHFRGTDKCHEAPRVSYECVLKEIMQAIHGIHYHKVKIFVATDEQAFLNYLLACFPGKVCYLPDVERSKTSDPLHHCHASAAYLVGEGAVLDCILLAQSRLLIRTSSNLSRWSTYLNPHLSVIELNQRW